MNRKKLLENLNKEKKNLGQRIMVLSNSLYFAADMPSKDHVREQLDAMDDYFEALEARICDLEHAIDMAKIFDEACEACQPAEEKEEPKRERNFIDLMCDELTERVDELIDLVHTHNDKHDTVSISDLDGKQVINTNPPHCHECCNDGSGCVKLILPGDQHICLK